MTRTPAHRAEPGSGSRHLALLFVGLMLSMLLAALNQTVLSTALPTIVGELNGVDEMLWVITAYILASTIMMPVYGKLGDLMGRKPLLLGAILVFMAGSVVGALAGTIEVLIAARAIQGLGGGGLISNGDTQWMTAGAGILHARLQLIDALAPQVATAYGQLTDGTKETTLRYVSSVLPESAAGDAERLRGFTPADLHQLILDACEASEQRELERGLTLVGPHRDELELLLGTAPARGYASHGETWSYALALRLGSWYVHLADDPTEGAAPILVLDDVFAELDARRRSRLAAIVASAEQVLVTAAVEEDLPAELVAGPHDVVRVGPGTAVRDDEQAPAGTGPEPEEASSS